MGSFSPQFPAAGRSHSGGWSGGLGFGVMLATVIAAPALRAADAVEVAFVERVQPILQQYCYDCHGDGSRKGGVSLDEFKGEQGLRDHELWLRAMKNLRSGIMPPAAEERPTDTQIAEVVSWIKRDVFALDPAHPDPGRVTVRRLNREEYRNTVRELVGIDFDTQTAFPPDDTGHGFDTIADVLTISPMLMEKYLDAAQAIIAEAVPTQPMVVAEHVIAGPAFVATSGAGGAVEGRGLNLSYYDAATVAAAHRVEHAGDYQLVLDLRAVERYVDNQFDLNKCRFVFAADGETLLDREFVREGDKRFEYSFDRAWAAGEHTLTIMIEPLSPGVEQKRQLRLRVNAVTVRGPLAAEHWVQPDRYTRFFPGTVPADARQRQHYTHDLLAGFATRAFRRPVDDETVDRLVHLADEIAAQPGNTYESGVAQAMVAVLASPRFLFREERVEAPGAGEKYPLIDEYALASRLSYFFWSSMPDEELFRLARERRLRATLAAQVKRLLDDPRSAKFVRNFTGQWLQARDIATVSINSLDVMLREKPDPEFLASRDRFRSIQRIPEEERTEEQKATMLKARAAFIRVVRAPRPELSPDLREAMQAETEMVFAHVLREDRNVLELLDSDYTFLNAALAKHYGIEGVTGEEMRKVALPLGSPRGGVLTQGTVLAVTSNPTRTSPVKRGVFILDNILGAPPPPPPPNIPALENTADGGHKDLSLRASLALHASDKTCRACHNRMDPLGLALENFNALGVWRETEFNQPIDATGTLISGESFPDIRELKRVLVTQHRDDFFHCLSEKLLTYALGRGLEYYDTETLDQLVARLEARDGRLSDLLVGIVESAPFQRSRPSAQQMAGTVDPTTSFADLKP